MYATSIPFCKKEILSLPIFSIRLIWYKKSWQPFLKECVYNKKKQGEARNVTKTMSIQYVKYKV